MKQSQNKNKFSLERVDLGLDLNMKMLQQYCKIQRNLDGYKRIFPNSSICSHGLNLCCVSIDFPICLLWERRRDN